MSEGYRDWTHPDGDLPEQAPEGLVDIYTAPWLAARETAESGASSGDEASLAWLVVLAVVLLLLLGWWAWRRRADLRLWWTLWGLERRSRQVGDAAGWRDLQDRVVGAIGRWQHGGRAPRRDRLAEPWSAWVREIDHERFAQRTETVPDARRASLAARLRTMRRAVWRREAS
ncbi:MAG: LPXTG cell wall anchor domain-containing protein [Guyparkeria sp.]|uniref:LPXTG cell wall anchor domain-containing protein n=1 Tax=Guyparkeria sp. TaxID=2035736 RepID=UPI00397A974F